MEPKNQLLLILDLNKVLVHRRKRRRTFHTRPFAKEFILGMSKRFKLSVWTSCSQKNGQQIVQSLFDDIDLLFVWYCDRCIRTLVPIGGHKADTTAIETFEATSIEDREDLEETKIISLKPLISVWSEFPQYSQCNTLLLDDSAEKCYENPPINCIHPFPYVFFSDDDVDDETIHEKPKKMNKKEKKRKLLALEQGILLGTTTNNTELETATETTDMLLLQGDTELRPGGALWCYLDRIANTWQQSEMTDVAVIVTEVGVYQSPSMSEPTDNTSAAAAGSGVDQSMSIPISS